jgi:hypothetical protein
MTTSGNKLMVRVIGKDGIMRSSKVDRSVAAKTGLIGNKYIYTQEDVFLVRAKKFDIFPYDQPCIEFYEGSPDAVPKHMSGALAVDVGNASIAIATLLRGAEKAWQMMMLILVILAIVAAGGGAALGYLNYQTLNTMKVQVADTQNMTIAHINTPSQTGGGGVISPFPIITAHPTQTVRVTPTVAVITNPVTPHVTPPVLGK